MTESGLRVDGLSVRYAGRRQKALEDVILPSPKAALSAWLVERAQASRRLLWRRPALFHAW